MKDRGEPCDAIDGGSPRVTVHAPAFRPRSPRRASTRWGQAILGTEQKQPLRWDDQPQYIANSHNPVVPDAALDAAMRTVWAAFRDA